jgi:catechol-2,3-dioxygenase
MIDHITLTVKDYPSAKAFYKKALAPLGFVDLAGAHLSPAHIAFSGRDKKEVQDFYTAAIAAGGKDNGSPDYHSEYGEGYYAGFIFDLEGNNIEVVYRDSPKY